MLKEIKKATSAKVVYLRHKEQFIRENLIPGPNEFVFLVEDNGLAIFNFLLQIAFEQDIENLQQYPEHLQLLSTFFLIIH